MHITIAINISCMDIAHLDGGGSQRQVLACSGKTLQSEIVIGLYIIKHCTKLTHFLLKLYLWFGFLEIAIPLTVCINK